VVSRFLLDLRLGPRTVETASEMLATVAQASAAEVPPLILVDDYPAYVKAILQVFGVVKHRRRRRRHGRFKHPTLKAPAGLLVGVVQKIRDRSGRLIGVRTKALFGRLWEVRRRVRRLKIGRQINTAFIERLNGTLRSQQARLARRTRNGSRLAEALQWALWLWRDLYNWVRPHGSLGGRTPAMALGLAQTVWTVRRYVVYPVHLSDLQRQEWLDERTSLLESALEAYQRKKRMPTS
jgi:hypothetical protein